MTASKWRYFWEHFEEACGAFTMGVMAFLSFMNVITRYVLNYSTAWTEELVTYIFVWATLLGTSLAYRHGSNLMVAFLYSRTHGALKKALYLSSAAASIFFFGVLGYYGAVQVYEEFSYKTQMESVMFPMGVFSAAIPICSALIIVRILQKTRTDLAFGLEGRSAAEEAKADVE